MYACLFVWFNATATTEIHTYGHTLSLHDALPICPDFAIWWDEQNVLDPEGGERRFFHPKDGPLAYEQVNFLPAAAPGFRVVLLLPRPVCAGPSGSGDVFGRRLGGALVSRNPWSHQIGRSHV